MISSAIRARRLVGRAQECAFFEARAAAAMRGQAAVVVLLGEAGGGKTRLLRSWRAIAQSRGFAVASTQNYAFARTPYASIVESLSPLVASDPRALPSSAQERALLERFLSSSVPEPHGTEPRPWEKRRLLAVIQRTLSRVASIGPLAIFIDDAHWIDAESLEVVQYLATTCADQRTIIVLAARSEAHERSAALDETLAALDRLECVYQVQLDALQDEDVRELILATAPASDPLSHQAIVTICRLSEGNPLFAEDLVRHAIAGADSDELLPESIEQSVRRRVQTLGETGRGYLEVAAAIGATFDSGLVAELAGIHETEIEAALRRARDLDLIVVEKVRPGSYRFRHELTRVAVDASSLPAQRRDIHRRIATMLERSSEHDASDATLAWHWDRAGDRARAAHYAELAGDAEVARHAYLSAREHFELALSHAALSDRQCCDVQEKLGQIALALGDVTDAATHFEAALEGARRIGDRNLALQALVGLQHAKTRSEDLDAALALADQAIALVQPEDPKAFECYALAALIATFRFLDVAEVGHEERGAERVATYIARARSFGRPGDAASELRLLNAEAKMAVFRDDAGLAREKAVACAEVSRSTDNPAHRSMGLTYFLSIARELADFTAMNAAIGELIAVTDECGTSFVAATSRGLGAQTSYLLGDVAGARDLMYAACAHGFAWPRVRTQLAVFGIPIALAADDMLLLERVAAPNILDEILAGKKLLDMEQQFLAAHLDLAAARGDGDRLRQLVDFAIENLPGMANHHAIAVPLARYVDDARLDCVAALLPSHDGAMGFLAILRSLARAAIAKRRGDASASDLVEVAASRARRARSPIFEAIAQEVGGCLRDAVDIYRAVGASGDVRRLEPHAGSTKRTMSRREREIADLVGHGLSNRAIGERLSISDRTVEHHIASVFNKLGLRSRAELMAYVIRSASAPQERAGESGR